MNFNIRVTCNEDGFSVTLEKGQTICHGEGESLSEALMALAEEVELSNFEWNYIREITGAEV